MSIGIDIVSLKHIKNEELLAKKILSKEEYEIYLRRVNKKEFLAGRWAAKEAFLKANGVGLIGKNAINMADISIVNEKNGRPILKYKDKIYDVSISHEEEYAVAVVNI